VIKLKLGRKFYVSNSSKFGGARSQVRFSLPYEHVAMYFLLPCLVYMGFNPSMMTGGVTSTGTYMYDIISI
jgi:hypothetical protein